MSLKSVCFWLDLYIWKSNKPPERRRRRREKNHKKKKHHRRNKMVERGSEIESGLEKKTMGGWGWGGGEGVWGCVGGSERKREGKRREWGER